MFGWVSSWWTKGFFSGPARNAPNDGKNIKEILEKSPEATSKLLSEEILQKKISSLRKITTNETRPLFTERSPILLQLENVSVHGYREYFLSLKKSGKLRRSRSETFGATIMNNIEIGVPMESVPLTL